MNQDLPGIIDRPSAWVGKDMAAHPESWCYRLSEADLADLEQAACHFLSLGRDIGQITARDFPLQHFGEQIASLSNELLHGCGFRLLRGLPIAGYSRELAATIFSGIGVWLGCPRSQNAQGHLLGHVRDIGLDPAASTTRIYQTSVRQTFHTDSADVVGLLCLQMARRGGESLLVSAETLYNEMLKRHPELVPALFEVVATDRRGEVPDGEDPWFEIPVLNWHAGFLTVQYQRQYVDSAQRFATAPRLRAQLRRRCMDPLSHQPRRPRHVRSASRDGS